MARTAAVTALTAAAVLLRPYIQNSWLIFCSLTLLFGAAVKFIVVVDAGRHEGEGGAKDSTEGKGGSEDSAWGSAGAEDSAEGDGSAEGSPKPRPTAISEAGESIPPPPQAR